MHRRFAPKSKPKGGAFMRLISTFCLMLALVLAGTAHAHIGEKVFLIFEIPDADLGDIDLFDGDISDWEDVVGDASLTPEDFFADPTVGDGAQYDPADMDYRVWLGWNNTNNRLYLAAERTDNVYINEYAGGAPASVWQHDSVEFMVDGDHSGGQYNFGNSETMTDEEKALNQNRQAQKWNAIFDSPDGRFLGYPGRADWLNSPPLSDGGGASVGEGPTTSVLEIYVTPYDDIVFSDQAASVATDLEAGNIIGFQIAMPDFDEAPQQYRGYHTLSGQAATFRFAERFVDGQLVGAGDATAVADRSWARIKASFSE
ncbi:MAG: hypothetical protein F4Z57_14400 [Gemmatimonadetes bacterium]|nr:hypothetical protein [Gemmatimonadota bacterium]MYC70114.1 hypothetical protein [Gemmatimonadota bacterium]MYI61839.1 hypothetical protein [Gemmatimonadota bacterium]